MKRGFKKFGKSFSKSYKRSRIRKRVHKGHTLRSYASSRGGIRL